MQNIFKIKVLINYHLKIFELEFPFNNMEDSDKKRKNYN